MVTQESLQYWLEAKCPTFWSILNQKAKRCLPAGIVEYLSPLSGERRRQIAQAYPEFGPLELDEIGRDEAVRGRQQLQIADKHLETLVPVCGSKEVGDVYRRGLSGVNTEIQLAELLCEIALCASFTRLSPTLSLRPPSGRGTYCDVSFQLNGFTVYGEAKRYEDTWFSDLDPARPESRSLVKLSPGDKPYESSRPRAMDLSSKIREVPRQFPMETINLLFIFHSSHGEPRIYIQQALFGDSTFSMKPEEVGLKPDGLFAVEDWRAVSGCSLTRVSSQGSLLLLNTWDNPNADVPMPASVRSALGRLSTQNT